MTGDFILVIDEGTTSTRAMIFDRTLRQVAVAQAEIDLSFPADGWVEQDADAIWAQTCSVCRAAIAQIGGVEQVAAIGVTNQRETTIIWDRATSAPIAPAIVWQDRRTAGMCERLRATGGEQAVHDETGLLLDPYFSATKIAWLLDNTQGARERAQAGDLAFGTVDSFLMSRLTGGRAHVTDVTNASRTSLYRLGLGAAGAWSADMLDLFDVPRALLPDVRPSGGAFAETDPKVFGRAIPILSAIGDQQAALVGQGCLTPGAAKITYGTGAFLVANTGGDRPRSAHRLLGTVGYETAGRGAFALEGSIFNAGTVVKWLRDELGLVSEAADTEAMAAGLPDNGGVYFAPAFTGLGAPHWNAEARGVITGLTRGVRAAHIVRAGLEAVAYQTRDLLDAFAADNAAVSVLKVDGGMAANDWLMQFVADICDVTVERPAYTEMTALGAAKLAAAELGWGRLEALGAEQNATRFTPSLDDERRGALLRGWRAALRATVV